MRSSAGPGGRSNTSIAVPAASLKHSTKISIDSQPVTKRVTRLAAAEKGMKL